MTADINSEVARLKTKGVEFTMPIMKQRWGLLTRLKLPDGETLGLYEPRHPLAVPMSLKAQSEVKKISAKKNQRGSEDLKEKVRTNPK